MFEERKERLVITVRVTSYIDILPVNFQGLPWVSTSVVESTNLSIQAVSAGEFDIVTTHYNHNDEPKLR